MNSGRFKGKVALVTGGSRGIGRAVAELLSQEGASVAVNYRARAEEAAAVVAAIRDQGRKAVAVKADVASRPEVDAMVEQACSALGPIDILVNNAGLLATGTLLQYEPDEFERMWRVNVNGVLHATAAVAPSMIEKKYGRPDSHQAIRFGTGTPRHYRECRLARAYFDRHGFGRAHGGRDAAENRSRISEISARAGRRARRYRIRGRVSCF